MRTSLIMGIISLLLAIVFFIIFCNYEKYNLNHNPKTKEQAYLSKLQEVLFLCTLFAGSVFAICFLFNIPYLLDNFLKVLRNVFDF